MKEVINTKSQMLELENEVNQLRDRLDSLYINHFRPLQHWDAKHTLLASRVREVINAPYEKTKGQKRIEQLNVQKQQLAKLIEEVEVMFNVKKEEQVSL